jgi:hypothetical protein
MTTLIDLTGRRFGRLFVLSRANSQRGVYWRCRCDCEKQTTVQGANLCSGATRSCGCLLRETNRALKYRHGHARPGRLTPEYRSWRSLKNRCNNPRGQDYRNYGGRGIGVDARWLGKDGFLNFLHDMGRKPSPGHSIDRINNDLGYFKENCAWRTAKEQYHNRRPRSEWRRAA